MVYSGIFLLTCLFMAPAAAIEDPLGIFCGSRDCYEVLGIERAKADAKSVKKAYRQMSLRYHPDKNKDGDATAMFRLVAKASEVLGDEEQRELYDYYLDHPSQYYKVSGVHFYKSIPKTDVRYIVAGIVLLLSVLLPVLQHQRHEDAVRIVREGLPANGGGSAASVRLHQMCLDRYRERERAAGPEPEPGAGRSGGRAAGAKKPSQIIKDPAFAAIVRETLSEMQLDGPFRKPGITDILLVQLVMLPYTVLCWARGVSLSACAAAVLASTARPAEAPGPSAAESRPPKPKAKAKVPALAAPVEEESSSEEAESDPDDPEQRRRAEEEETRLSLQRVLLARTAGNSKKKQTDKGAAWLPFSKADVKYLCCRLEAADAGRLLRLATRPAARPGEGAEPDDLTSQLQLKLDEFKEHDRQFPSSILEQDVVAAGPSSPPPPAEEREQEQERPAVAAPRDWRREDLSMLARALTKYPGGTRQRWVLISNSLNEWIKPEIPFTPDECTKGANIAMKHLAKAKDISDSQPHLTVASPASYTASYTASGGAVAAPSAPNPSARAEPAEVSPPEWTQAQQTALEQGLKKHGADLDTTCRWELIADGVPGRSAGECLARYKALREKLKKKKKVHVEPAVPPDDP